MKKLYALAAFLCFSMAWSQINYDAFDTHDLETSIWVKEVSPLSVLKTSHDHYGPYSLLQSYKELSRADQQQRFNASEALHNAFRINTYSQTIFLGGLHAEFEIIEQSAIDEGKVTLAENGDLIRNTSDPIFEKHTKTIIAPLSINKKGLKTHFYFRESFFVNATNNSIVKILSDFGDGQGYRETHFDTNIEVRYPNAGTKELNFKLLFSDGEEITQRASLNISYSKADHANLFGRMQQNIISTDVADLSAYTGAIDFAGMGEYEIFLGADNTLDKPIIVIDGFDPFDTRDIAAVYDEFTYVDGGGMTQNLADRIRTEENFDVVVLNFPEYLRLSDNSLLSLDDLTDTNNDMVIDENDYPAGSTLIDGGADFIERNAMILITLINTLNGQKVGSEQNVIIGPSMGGIISRYALNYMESLGQDADTRLWISFDTPHLGANVPIGFQHLFNRLAFGLQLGGLGGDQSVTSLQPVVNGMLKSPAARQMLTDHFEPHLASGSNAAFDPTKLLPEPHPFNGIMYGAMSGLTTSGYPETVRKISMINGSGVGNPFQDKLGVDIVPGRQVLNTTIPDIGPLTDATLRVAFTPTSNTQAEISYIFIDAPFLCFCDLTDSADAQAPSFTDGIDAAMGGLFDMGSLAAGFGGDPLIDTFFAALQTDFFNFIPTISAMALDNQQDWYAVPNPNNGDMVNETIFDAWHMPTNNEPHITITDANATFAWNEIVNPVLSNDGVALEGGLIIEANPIDNNELVILSNGIQGELEVSLYNLSGQQLLQKRFGSPTNRNTMQVDLASGMYLVKMLSEGKIHNRKIIIE